MATIKYGNNLYVNDDDGIGNTIIIGNGVNDLVSAIGSQYDLITLGNGTGDAVIDNTTDFRNTSNNNSITLGNGANDSVDLSLF
jgi:hypothetical protein